MAAEPRREFGKWGPKFLKEKERKEKLGWLSWARGWTEAVILSTTSSLLKALDLKLWGGTSQGNAASVDALEAGGTACISLTTVGSSSLKNVYIGQNYSRKNGLNVFSFITWFARGGKKIRWLMEATWCKKLQGAFLFLLFFPVSGRVDERLEYLDLESYKSWPPRNFDMFDYVASRLC